MQVEFYIDVFFLINLFMNGILLVLTCKIQKHPIPKIRLFISAVVGALIACLSALMTNIPIFISFFIDYVATGILMILITFGKKSSRSFIHNYIVLLLCSFLLGGVIQSFSETFQAGNHLKGFLDTVLYGRTNLIVLVVLTVILTPVVFYFYHLMKQSSKIMNNLYEVKIILNKDKQIECKGLMDTGNSLRDPIKGWPVIIADYSLLKEELLLIQTEDPSAFCAIPYVSVGKEAGILYGIRVNSVVISNSQETICTKNVVVALSEHGFANKEQYGVLLHNELLGL